MGPRLQEPEAVPEAEADTAARAAQIIRRRRARGGRASTILSNQRAPEAAAGGASRPAGSFASGFSGGRGRGALINP